MNKIVEFKIILDLYDGSSITAKFSITENDFNKIANNSDAFFIHLNNYQNYEFIPFILLDQTTNLSNNTEYGIRKNEIKSYFITKI